jgi:tetratricopeptide (TPR) repeat protein
MLLVACGGGAGPAAGGPAKTGAVGDAKAAGDAKAVGVAAAPAGPGEDWLVWWQRGGGWTTRWLRVEGERAEVAGERAALVVGDGARLWQVERADGWVRVQSCECIDEPRSPECRDRGRMRSLGLRARPLGGGDDVAVVEASTSPEAGDGIWHGLTIIGGTQARLWVESSDSGYFCGAHGLAESRLSVFDVAAGKAAEDPPDGWWKRLPEPLRRGAAEEVRKGLAECDGEDASALEAVMNEEMRLERFALALDAGAPRVGWTFAASVPYVCSPDYAAHGEARSGMIPEAAPLGLVEPPAAVRAALREIGDAASLGLSRLALDGPARGAMLAAFTAVPEASWPREEASDEGDPGDAARARVDEGRGLSRRGDFPAAIAAFDAAIAADARLAVAWSGRGYARLRAGDLAQARTDLEKALTLDERPAFQAAVWFNLGQLAETAGKPDEARAAYRKSQALRATKQVEAALAALDAKPAPGR